MRLRWLNIRKKETFYKPIEVENFKVQKLIIRTAFFQFALDTSPSLNEVPILHEVISVENQAHISSIRLFFLKNYFNK